MRKLFEKKNEFVCIPFYPDNNQILGKDFLPWAGAILTILNAFKAYMSPAAKAEAHNQTSKYFDQLKLSFGNCSEVSEYKHLTNMYQTNITNAPGLPFFLRKRWVSRKERISITPQLQKKITRTNDYETTRGVIVKPGHCCCRINSQIDVIVHEDKNEFDKERNYDKAWDENGNPIVHRSKVGILYSKEGKPIER